MNFGSAASCSILRRRRFTSVSTLRTDGFTAELELDRDGLVVRYPELAERVGDEPSEP